MLNPADLRPEDRILLLGIPDPEVVAGIAGRLTGGLLVAMGDAAEVRAARAAARDCENVMFVVFDGPHIPWRDGFFTQIIDLRN
jgi:hypothetical protein